MESGGQRSVLSVSSPLDVGVHHPQWLFWENFETTSVRKSCSNCPLPYTKGHKVVAQESYFLLYLSPRNHLRLWLCL